MEIGTSIPHTGKLAEPEFIRDFCVAAEASGWDGLWAVDHLVMPRRTDSLYTLARRPAPIGDDAVSGLLAPNYEMMATLLWVAGFTSRIKLGTAVAVLTIRNPIHNARQLATLDAFSGGGRLLYGVGVGWLQEEAVAMNMPWDRRGTRADEHIELMRTLWNEPSREVEWHGPYFDLPPMDPRPQPLGKIPILIGGHSEAALDRAARLGDGWTAANMSPERFVEHRDQLFRRCEAHDRAPDELHLSNSVRVEIPEGDLSASDVDRLVGQIRSYEELGVHHLQVLFESKDRTSAIQTLERLGRDVLPACRSRR